MKTLKFKGRSGTCQILIGESFENIGKYCDKEKTIILVDSNVNRLHSQKFSGMRTIIIDAGENSKSHENAANLCRRLLELGADRKTFILCIGGGVVCDLGGFVASTFMRGIKFAYVPTTLLAQADAAIGGKNGINLDHYKNIIGTFTQPKFCLVDTDFLSTLPQNELSNGLAEIIKHGIISDPKLLDFIEKNHSAIFSRDKKTLLRLVEQSIKIKAKIAGADELEAGQRALLNFGHTVGHAIEKVTGIEHGKAIAIGMVAEARLSALKCGFAQKDTERIMHVLKIAGLPTVTDAEPQNLVLAMKKDKKNADGQIRAVVLKKLGSAKLAPAGENELLWALGG